MSDDYEVGYGKPPRHTQFKKGESGNPRGRPKGSQNFKTQVRKILNEKVVITDQTGRKSVSTQMAGLKRLREKALKGDPRALDRLLQLALDHNSEPDDASHDAKLSASDQEIMNAFTALLRRNERARATAQSDPSAEAVVSEDDDDAWLD